jgi:predicted phage-related endonuclease
VEFGKNMESTIREYYESFAGEWFPPAVVINDWSLASLDGINSSNTRIIEIKTCNKKVFSDAQDGVIPEYYRSQVQYGMMCVPSVKDCEMVFFNDGGYAHVIVERDNEYIDRLRVIGKEFYDICILDKEPPALTEKDYVRVILEDEFDINEYISTREQINRLTTLEKAQKRAIEDMGDSGNMEFCSSDGVALLRLTRVNKKGHVDWIGLCKKHNISDDDIESFRKDQIGYYSFKIMK